MKTLEAPQILAFLKAHPDTFFDVNHSDECPACSLLKESNVVSTTGKVRMAGFKRFDDADQTDYHDVADTWADMTRIISQGFYSRDVKPGVEGQIKRVHHLGLVDEDYSLHIIGSLLAELYEEFINFGDGGFCEEFEAYFSPIPELKLNGWLTVRRARCATPNTP